MGNSVLVLTICLAVAGVWALAVGINRRGIAAALRPVSDDAGTIVFVEPVRWLFIIWGLVPFVRGLRRGGCRMNVELHRWCTTAGALLVVPDLVRRQRSLRQAKRLAALLERLLRERFGPLYLVGYSSGTFIALEACRRLSTPDALHRLVLLAGSTSPDFAWEGLDRVIREASSFHSPLDIIAGVGPALFGTNDRRWSPGCGTVGFRHPPSWLTQRRWRPGDIRRGYLGGHFTVTAPAFVQHEIAPLFNRPTTPDSAS